MYWFQLVLVLVLVLKFPIGIALAWPWSWNWHCVGIGIALALVFVLVLALAICRCKAKSRLMQGQWNFKISGVRKWRWVKHVFAVKKILEFIFCDIYWDRSWQLDKKGQFGLLKCCLKELLIMQIMCFVANRSLMFFYVFRLSNFTK